MQQMEEVSAGSRQRIYTYIL